MADSTDDNITNITHITNITNITDITDSASPRDGLSAQLVELEAFVARSEAGGDAIPAEAMEMISRLREIVNALDGLTASLGDSAPDVPAAGDA